MSFSFEFFPARTSESLTELQQVGQTLARFNPDYFSVTFGAGGRAQNSTLETITTLQAQQVPIAAHITCINMKRQGLKQLLTNYQKIGINRLVVLRGDLPEQSKNNGDFRYAYQLVHYIREQFGSYFNIQVAAYPEKHPESPSTKADIEHLINKIKAGANGAITQYFYNVEAYFHLLDRLEKAGVNTPIVPGIMPITNYTQILRFSKAVGADIPRWLANQLADYQDDLASLHAFGLEVVARLCECLKAAGVNDFHFYTMNKAKPTVALINRSFKK